MHGWMDGWTDGGREGGMDAWMDGSMDGRTEYGCMVVRNRCMDGWMHACMSACEVIYAIYVAHADAAYHAMSCDVMYCHGLKSIVIPYKVMLCHIVQPTVMQRNVR